MSTPILDFSTRQRIELIQRGLENGNPVHVAQSIADLMITCEELMAICDDQSQTLAKVVTLQTKTNAVIASLHERILYLEGRVRR